MVPFMFCDINITSVTYFSMLPMLTRAIMALDAEKSCKYMKQFKSYDFKDQRMKKSTRNWQKVFHKDKMEH